MPRYVILEHDWPTLHWDFLLESGPILRAWRLPAEPGTARQITAEPNADHRLHYLDYEGPVSGERGSVKQWDAGTFEWLHQEAESIEIVLKGRKLTGRCAIARQANGALMLSLE